MNRLVRAVRQSVKLFLRQILNRSVERKSVCIRQSLKSASVPLRCRIERRDTVLVETFRFVRNHQVQVEFHFFAETCAFGTRAERIVKRKKPWLQFGNGNSAVGASVLLAEKNFVFDVVFGSVRARAARRQI